MARHVTPPRAATTELAAGPVVFVIGVAVMYFIRELGPFDRAQVQGLIGFPLLALVPSVAGLAGRAPDVRLRARTLIGVTAAVIGILALSATAASVTFVRCRPVSNPLDVLPDALVVGLLAAVTYGFAGTVALGSAARGRRWMALAEGAGTYAGLAAVSTLAIFTLVFPPLSCAAPH